ncbi:MAG TPA: type II toxin-antitoxin system mRNA interferase toxin, RelE/StbE family [Dehalococcoidia bacterium]|nr:type II toxin-antitoxin system mRNA interferase toxin, RelE/StbE family [Dehalococcoidia bacterium]
MVSSDEFRISETLTFQKKAASRIHKQYYSRIKDNIYPVLRNNPFFGPNIKRLKGELSSIYRYRIGDYRLFYTIDSEMKIVFILDVAHRKDAYR